MAKKADSKKTDKKNVDKPFFRFSHSKKLRTQTLKVLDKIDDAEDPTIHRGALASLVVELTDAGMTFFFLDPLHKLKMGFVMDQTANLGLSSVLRILAPMVRNIIGRMDDKQLRFVSTYIRDLMD